MLKVVHTNGDGLPDYPEDLGIRDTVVYVHDSCMAVQHDTPCTVCHKHPAVYQMQTGVMEPCWVCQQEGNRLIKVMGWRKKLIDLLT